MSTFDLPEYAPSMVCAIAHSIWLHTNERDSTRGMTSDERTAFADMVDAYSGYIEDDVDGPLHVFHRWWDAPPAPDLDQCFIVDRPSVCEWHARPMSVCDSERSL